MTASLRSRTGWTLVAAYLLLAAVVWYEAFTCTGWVCDLAAMPAVVPLGIPIGWLFNWVDLRSWYFIAPTVLANSVFYYLLGHLLGGLVNRLRRRRQASSHTKRA